MNEPETVPKPIRLLALPIVKENGHIGGNSAYVLHPAYSGDPRHYVAALKLIRDDLFAIFEYVEPADSNNNVYSHRIHQLLLRVCVEVEAHFRNILRANDYQSKNNVWRMCDYQRVEHTHRLSAYSVRYPGWRGQQVSLWRPFAPWAGVTAGKLPWWESYNASKHDRNENFEKANLGCLMNAIAGLIVLYHAQYSDENYSSAAITPAYGLPRYDTADGMQGSILYPFRIAKPESSQYPFLYGFRWDELRDLEQPFEVFDYTKVKVAKAAKDN